MIAQVVPAKRGVKTLPFFDYLIPKELENQIKVGQLVEIPLRNNFELGIIIGITKEPSNKLIKLRDLKRIVINKPLLKTEMISFISEIAELYHASLGSIIKSALPPLQKRKLSKINDNFDDKIKNSTFGKPDYFVYKDLADKLSYLNQFCNQDGQLLIIVPEINEAKILFDSLNKIFFDQIALLTSDSSERDYFSSWFDVWSGSKKIVISTRIGIFLSFQNLSNILVIDPFHEGHKSWDMAPRYHTRDAALILGKHLDSKVSFATHTPSIEDYYFIKNNIYNLTSDNLLPSYGNVEIVNMSQEARVGNFSPISLPLQDAIEQTPSGNIFIFCNRRGTAAYVFCRDCGTAQKCENCARTMTYHEKDNKLYCHHCGINRDFEPICTKCSGMNISFFGAGTEGIFKEVSKLFSESNKEIFSFDKETIDAKKINNLKNSIIIGTSAVWQYLDWTNVSLICFADADTPLHNAEYLSAENVWFSLRDAIFRLPSSSRIIIQTRQPEHQIYLALSDPANFYEHELGSRKLFGYPPFRYILKLFAFSDSEQQIINVSAKFYSTLGQLTKKYGDIKITPPLPMFPYYLNGKYRKTILLKLPYRNYKQLIKLILKLTPPDWKIDPNPIKLLSI